MPTFNRWVIAVLTCVAALPAHAGSHNLESPVLPVERRRSTSPTSRGRKRAPRSRPERPGSSLTDAVRRNRGTGFRPCEMIRCLQRRRRPAPHASPAPASSFPALADDTTAIPPDTHGAVGPNHLMTVLNTQVRIQNRTGVVLSTVPMDSFWASLGNPNAFDPRIAYDLTAADGSRCGRQRRFTASAVLIGVSQTNDPTGVWNLFSVDADGSNATSADYTSLGFNKDWIVVSMNMFTVVQVPLSRDPMSGSLPRRACTTTSLPRRLSGCSRTRAVVPRWFRHLPTTRHWRRCTSSMSSPVPPLRFASARSQARWAQKPIRPARRFRPPHRPTHGP